MRSGLLLYGGPAALSPCLWVSTAFIGILETQLKHVGYELDMLVYTFDKLLLVEPLVFRSFQAGQVNTHSGFERAAPWCVRARRKGQWPAPGSPADYPIFGSKADIQFGEGNVRSVPETDSRALQHGSLHPRQVPLLRLDLNGGCRAVHGASFLPRHGLALVVEVPQARLALPAHQLRPECSPPR
jgi:hypothetical protein